MPAADAEARCPPACRFSWLAIAASFALGLAFRPSILHSLLHPAPRDVQLDDHAMRERKMHFTKCALPMQAY
jgi:hypothetical protein